MQPSRRGAFRARVLGTVLLIGCGGAEERGAGPGEREAGSPASAAEPESDAEVQPDANPPVQRDATVRTDADANPTPAAEAGLEASVQRDDGGVSSPLDAHIALDASADARAEAGPSSADASADAGTEPGDADITPDAARSYAQDFNARLRAAIERTESPSSCAAVLPVRRVASLAQTADVARDFIAQTRRVPTSSLANEQTLCGGNTGQTCARRFQHHIYKSSGSLGEALFPFAMELEQRSMLELRIWTATVDGITQPADISFVAWVDGQTLGMVVFNDLADCRR